MTIALPWHSNPSWQPTEVTQFINHVNSGAGTLIVRTDAGLAYLKAIGNPDGPHALVKDLLGTHLAAMLGLPTFDYAVIEVTDLDELPFFKAGKAEPGPAFVTRGEEGSVWDAMGLVPHQWHLDSPVRSALASYLFQRATLVAETIESRLFDPPQLTIDLSDGGKS